ncbi:GntR family transcriptional regulator [Rhodopila sp.]|jgi:DNA-binding GntR family transcriptional regulator|uniref:GntR family transcriptional regulator n=1 Tax=Rhodopila sp. TaxID=2480087 RepID=UPI002C8EBB77|nr:GntR family transcriptional regulator [Rhodopila sp.]HVZ06714.1 GntR family transcriptional regulator [Rhodopila sp.]
MFDITKSTMAQQIARAIADAIVHGQLQSGERLNEIELGARFGTSRAPIREATYILEQEGVVVRHTRRGVFVKDYTAKELRDLYDTTYRLEAIALRRVIEVASDGQIAALNRTVERMAGAAAENAIPAYIEQVEAMFQELFRIADNTVMQDFYAQLRNRLKPFRFMSLSHPASLSLSLQEYRDIVAGLEQRSLSQVEEAHGRKERRAITRLLEARSAQAAA